MKRILIATVAVFGFAGLAFADTQAPVLNGDVSANVENNYEADAQPEASIDLSTTASIRGESMNSDMRWDDAARFNDPEGGR